jgi:hypothetical protein
MKTSPPTPSPKERGLRVFSGKGLQRNIKYLVGQ